MEIKLFQLNLDNRKHTDDWNLILNGSIPLCLDLVVNFTNNMNILIHYFFRTLRYNKQWKVKTKEVIFN